MEDMQEWILPEIVPAFLRTMGVGVIRTDDKIL